MNSNTLTAAQVKALLAYQNSAADKTTVSLDPTNPAHKAIIDTMLAAGGKTENDFPHLFGTMASAKPLKTAAGSAPLDTVCLVDSGKTTSGNATASVWATSEGKTLTNGGTLMVFDAGSGELLAQGTNSAVKSGFLACTTQAGTAKPATSHLSVLYLGHVVDSDGASRYFSYTNKNLATGVTKNPSAKKSVSSAAMATSTDNMSGIQCNVEDPRIRITGHTQIQIAVGRILANSPSPTTTDYVYVEPSVNENNPFLIAPFKGNVALSGIIDLSSLTPSALTSNIIVVNQDGTSTNVPINSTYTTNAKLTGALTASGNQLTWDYPYDGLGYAATNSIVYNANSMASEKVSYFYYAFNGIPLNGGDTAPPFYVCSTGSPEEKSVNCTEIPALYYLWHCVLKDTMVTLEDGSKKPIQDINETYRVRTADGKSLAVIGTVLGRHSSDPSKGKNEVYKLVTGNGKILIATECHMLFMADNKCRMISHIEVGDPILTEDGVSEVIECHAVKGDDMFYGLVLGSPEEKKSADFPHTMASFYSNGILSGDQEVMKHHSDEAYHDLEYMLPRIEPHLRQDYHSALMHKRY